MKVDNIEVKEKSKLVGFLGAPGTGKTTISCAMKEYLLNKSMSSEICTEYAREYVYRYGHPKHIYTQYRITTEQIAREDLLLKGQSPYIFTDSPVWLGYIYSILSIDRNDDYEIHTALSDMYEKFVLNQIKRYHKVFYLTNSCPMDDGCRDMDLNEKIESIIGGFVASHRHILPIIDLDIPIKETEARKEFVWDTLNRKG
jgi:nicotinamide riboside kinase